MAKRKRKIRIVRIIVAVMIIIGLSLVLYFSLNSITKNVNQFDDKEVVDNADIEHTDIKDEVKIQIVDYKVYIDENKELGFNFILADLEFTSSASTIYYDLYNLSTSERINLGNIEKYENKLESIGIELGSLGYNKEIKNDQSNKVICKVLIPYEAVRGELNVYNGEVLKFDIRKNKNKVESLKIQDDSLETIIDEKSYNITVYDSYIETVMFHNDELAEYPSSVDIYTFVLNVNSISKDNIYVEDAKFIPNGSSNNHEALDETYSGKIDNVIKKKLKENDIYALFFAVTNTGEFKESFDGKLLIKFSDNNNWLELSTLKEDNNE